MSEMPIHATEKNVKVRNMRLADKSQKEITEYLLSEQERENATQTGSEGNPEITQIMQEQQKTLKNILQEIEQEGK